MNVQANQRCIGLVIAEREDKATGETSSERRYYINTMVDVDTCALATRSHWGVENSLH